MYWKSSGAAHTVSTVELALETATARKISYVVVASNTGSTALLLAGKVPHLICVTHANGFAAPGENELLEENRAALIAQGVQVLTTTHVLSGVERGVSKKFGGVYPAELIAQSLRMFGQGVKVCVEISIMALDAGLIPHGTEVIAIGGTGRGADTALILTPAHAANIFDTVIREIICKP